MIATWRPVLLLAAGIFTAAAAIPASVYAAVEREGAPQLGYDLASFSPSIIDTSADGVPSADATASVDGESLACMAKVVHHESRGQPRRGMLAVAQTLVNRVKAGGRFGRSICEVANQPGQYFQTAGYHPREDAEWQQAVEVSRATLDGSAEPVVPGALFFHAASYRGNGFFHSRQRVAAIGGQVFYR